MQLKVPMKDQENNNRKKKKEKEKEKEQSNEGVYKTMARIIFWRIFGNTLQQRPKIVRE